MRVHSLASGPCSGCSCSPLASSAVSRLPARPATGAAQHSTRRAAVAVRCQHNEEGEAQRAGPGAQQLYRLLGQPPVVGADHGEGFVHFRTSGEAYLLDVDKLNEQLRHSGAIRLRHAMKPDEAFGMVFNFDGCVADVPGVRREAWALVAEREKLPLLPGVLERPEILRMSPEYIATQVLRWAQTREDASRLAFEHAGACADLLAQLTAPQPGVREWLNALTSFNVPCALVSRLDRATVRRCLERMCLHDHFDAMVTAEDDMESIAQQLLSASMKLSRPPNMCVYFAVTPEDITAAHNCTMKAVAVQGGYRAYQLKAADVTCGSLSELTVYNVRRLFANAGSEFMDLQKATSSKKADGGNGQGRRRITNAVI